MIAKCKRVACTIGPAKVHRGRLKVEAPCIFDMLTDVVEDGVNREDLSLGWSHKKTVCEQCILFKSAKCR